MSAPVTCPKCGRPKATAREIIARHSGAERLADGACWREIVDGELNESMSALVSPEEMTSDLDTVLALLYEARARAERWECTAREFGEMLTAKVGS